MIIGLTGGSGTGKSSVAKVFENRGFVIVDFDKISRTVTMKDSECLNELVGFFGSGILNSDKTLDRRKLGEIVFSDKSKLEALNEITHKHILMESERITTENRDKNIVYDAPLLFEANLHKKCDCVVSVLSDIQKRIERICKRDSITETNAKNRIENQHDDDFYIKNSDYCIYNNETVEELENKTENLIRSIFNELCSR